MKAGHSSSCSDEPQGNPKHQIRNPKSETNSKLEYQNHSCGLAIFHLSWVLDLEFVSDFGFRILDGILELKVERLGGSQSEELLHEFRYVPVRGEPAWKMGDVTGF